MVNRLQLISIKTESDITQIPEIYAVVLNRRIVTALTRSRFASFSEVADCRLISGESYDVAEDIANNLADSLEIEIEQISIPSSFTSSFLLNSAHEGSKFNILEIYDAYCMKDQPSIWDAERDGKLSTELSTLEESDFPELDAEGIPFHTPTALSASDIDYHEGYAALESDVSLKPRREPFKSASEGIQYLTECPGTIALILIRSEQITGPTEYCRQNKKDVLIKKAQSLFDQFLDAIRSNIESNENPWGLTHAQQSWEYLSDNSNLNDILMSRQVSEIDKDPQIAYIACASEGDASTLLCDSGFPVTGANLSQIRIHSKSLAEAMNRDILGLISLWNALDEQW